MEKTDLLPSSGIQSQPAAHATAQPNAGPAAQPIPGKQPSKWLRVVDVINRISVIMFEFFQPYNNLDRFQHSVEAIRERRWRTDKSWANH